MADENQAPAPKARISKASSVSMVWFIPILALALGAWLVYKNKQDQGPLITITFEAATGLEPGKTKIKYKDVDLGIVQNIDIKDDLSGVIVSARMNKGTKSLLNENTKFWVIKPRVGLEGVSGLSTLLSGAYIGIDASQDGKPATSFAGLENPPPREHTVAGSSIRLQAEHPRSIKKGSPVYFRQFQVGQIDSIELSDDFSTVEIRAFVESPYDELINQNSKFWNVGGITAKLSASGISVQLESIESLVYGGIAFDSPAVAEDLEFDNTAIVYRLYENMQSVGQVAYTEKGYFVLNFDQSIRGLSIGAPVDYRGIEIGQVVSIDIDYNKEQDKVYIPVLVEIDRGRAGIYHDGSITSVDQDLEKFQKAVDRGLRARLQTGNLLTGQLYVSVDFFPEAEKVEAGFFDGYPEIPTLPSDLGKITANITEVLEKVNRLEIEKVLDNVNLAITEVRELIGDTDSRLLAVLDSIDRTMADSRKLMQGLDEDSMTRYELNTLFREMQEAARSVRTLVETIEENPNSVIFGKSNRGGER